MILLNSKASEKCCRKMQECFPLALPATLLRYLVQTCDQIAFELRLNKSQMIVINHNLVYEECFVNKTAVWVIGTYKVLIMYGFIIPFKG
jgi:hypothetical protein